MDMIFYRACMDPSFPTYPLFRSWVLGLASSKLGLYCFVPYKQQPECCDIQIDKRTCGLSGSTLHFYFFVSSKHQSDFRDRQIDRRTPRLAGSRFPLFTDGHPYQLSNIIKKNDFQILNY
jgi:hypothetical protein